MKRPSTGSPRRCRVSYQEPFIKNAPDFFRSAQLQFLPGGRRAVDAGLPFPPAGIMRPPARIKARAEESKSSCP